MPDALRQRLRQSLIARYAHLRQRLERVVSSREDASDALQETWVQLEGVGKGVSVKNDEAYLLRMATNIAADLFKRRSGLITPMDLNELTHVADDVHDTARHALARIELDELIGLLENMPARQRAVLIAFRVDGLSYAQIAKRFGISASLVHKEMKGALAYLRLRLSAQAGVPVAPDSKCDV